MTARGAVLDGETQLRPCSAGHRILRFTAGPDLLNTQEEHLGGTLH